MRQDIGRTGACEAIGAGTGCPELVTADGFHRSPRRLPAAGDEAHRESRVSRLCRSLLLDLLKKAERSIPRVCIERADEGAMEQAIAVLPESIKDGLVES